MLHVISSMATRQVLNDLAAQFQSQTGLEVRVESVGGVDAAKRVRAGEVFDIVALASNVVDALIAEGHLVAPRLDIVTSAIGIGVRAGSARPDISTADAVKQAVAAASKVGYSTGPSGTYLAGLFERWGFDLKEKVTVAPPGVPVTSLVAKGEIALGFQQLSELAGEGVDVVGVLPPEIQSLTVFSGGVAAKSAHAADARRLLEFLASAETAETKRRYLFEA